MGADRDGRIRSRERPARGHGPRAAGPTLAVAATPASPARARPAAKCNLTEADCRPDISPLLNSLFRLGTGRKFPVMHAANSLFRWAPEAATGGLQVYMSLRLQGFSAQTPIRRWRNSLLAGNSESAFADGRRRAERRRASPSGLAPWRGPQLKFSSLKKSAPLSSTTMKAGKFSTSIRHTASIPSSGYSCVSTFLMQSCASRAAGPPIEPR